MIAAIKEGMGLKTCMRSLLRSACAALLLATGFSIPTTARADTITYYHNDFLGSPVVATNSSGAVLWRQSYKPYGERMANEEASFGNKIRYTSRHEDDDTDLVYMGARYYDPVAGRFMGVDSIRFDEINVHSFNRYAYANNNPFKYVDPDGDQAASVLKPLAPPPVRVGIGAYEIATMLGAGVAGSWLTLKGYDLIYKESEGQLSSAEPDAGQNEGGKETGSYTNTHESGRKYHGKGDRARSQQSGRDKEKEYGDRHVATDWTASSGDREALRDEARRIEGDRGASNPENYNKINSPGKKYLD